MSKMQIGTDISFPEHSKVMKTGKFIGQIGLGYSGEKILRNLYELGVLHSACDSEPHIISERKGRIQDIKCNNGMWSHGLQICN